jgi:hypothetical protein
VVNIRALCDRRGHSDREDLQQHEVICLIVLGLAAGHRDDAVLLRATQCREGI